MTATFADRFADAFRNILPLEGPWPLTSARILEYLGGPQSAAGTAVNADSVLGIPAAYAANRVIAEAVAMLPLHVFERIEPRGRRQAVDHPLYQLLHEQPNSLMTSFQLRETLQGHLNFRGNAFCEIERGLGGQPVALWPLRPDKMGRPVVSGAGQLIYPYTLPDGLPVSLPQVKVLHLRGLSPDGLWGYSPITIHREAFGHALATQEYGARFFGQGAKPGGVLQAKGKLSPDGAKRMKESWEAAHQGLSMAHRVAVLEEGVEWHAVGMTNEDAQFIESRNFTITEMARIFNIKPHKIADLSRSNFSNIEQETISHVTDTVQPWAERWEQQLHVSLFLPNERTRYYPKFMLNGLLRGDTQSRTALYTALFDRATLSPNDILELEDMELIADPSGDARYYQTNMAPVGTAPVPQAVMNSLAELRQKLDATVYHVEKDVERDADGKIVRLYERHVPAVRLSGDE